VNGTTGQIPFCFALTLVATAYAAVGQGGATGYIAVMGLTGFAPDVTRPAALTLNVVVVRHRHSAVRTIRTAEMADLPSLRGARGPNYFDPILF
jgi:hypothetical protein